MRSKRPPHGRILIVLLLVALVGLSGCTGDDGGNGTGGGGGDDGLYAEAPTGPEMAPGEAALAPTFPVASD